MSFGLPDIAAAVGSTPIVRLARLGAAPPHFLYGKCEFMNPGGSIKDRVAGYMIDQAIRRGALQPGGTIVEATAGNTGTALAMIAALRGFKMTAVVTTKASREKLDTLRAFGARIVICRAGVAPTDPAHFIATARRIAHSTRGGWCAEQFSNADNIRAHYHVTGPELFAQTGGRMDVLVAGIGTGGTLHGVAMYLREKMPALRIVAADPSGSCLAAAHAGLEGHRASSYLVEGIGGDFVPDNARLDLVDEFVTVGDAEARAAMLMAARREGLLVGSSSGCILAAALRYARRATGVSKHIVALLPDGGRSYLSTFYSDRWWAAHCPDGHPRRVSPTPQQTGERPCTSSAIA